MNTVFSILYNGHPVVITPLGNNIYRVQITYKPINIELIKNNNDSSNKWVEVESRQETYLTKEVGRLITNYHS